MYHDFFHERQPVKANKLKKKNKKNKNVNNNLFYLCLKKTKTGYKKYQKHQAIQFKNT
tara:strand:- start:971 stop:1144 length:174 start_codon:yes stop_codon:yes gene_type:complete